MFKLLCEIMSMCVKITKESKADCFFEYMGHVDAYDVRVYHDGWSNTISEEDHRQSYLAFVKDATVANLEETKKELQLIAKQLGVEV